MQHKTHNCFVSYHHARDQQYIEHLREKIAHLKVADYSLKTDIGHLSDETIYRKIREKMYNCSITVVLVGERTGYRKWIDWELWSSLRAYTHPKEPLKSFRPNGILAIYLPVPKHSIPDRLKDNLRTGYAVSMRWEDLDFDLEHKIHMAHMNRTNHLHTIDNSRPRMKRDYRGLFGIKF